MDKITEMNIIGGSKTIFEPHSEFSVIEEGAKANYDPLGKLCIYQAVKQVFDKSFGDKSFSDKIDTVFDDKTPSTRFYSLRHFAFKLSHGIFPNIIVNLEIDQNNNYYVQSVVHKVNYYVLPNQQEEFNAIFKQK